MFWAIFIALIIIGIFNISYSKKKKRGTIKNG